MAGWGKQATQKVDRKQFENDELLKSLGTQFNVDFGNYEKWQRRTTPKAQKVDATTALLGVQKKQFIIGKVEYGKQPSYREKKQAAKKEQLDKDKAERVKILELRISTRRKTMLEYKKRHKELLLENLSLREDIDADEEVTHSGVKGLLRRYEKFRGGISNLNTNFAKEYEAAIKDLEKRHKVLEKELAELEVNVEDMDSKLREKQDQLHILMNYKDKEYPVKAMKIANLQRDIQQLNSTQQEDQGELKHIIDTELGKYEKDRVKVSDDITKDITEKAIALMHPSWKDMAMQNLVMKKEIEFHDNEQEDLEMVIEQLEKEVKSLLHDPKTNTKLQMFPEFFPLQQKCTPDMEVVLDIPTQQWLPI